VPFPGRVDGYLVNRIVGTKALCTALGQVGRREALEPWHRAVQYEPGTDQLPAVVPAEGLAAPLGLDSAPRRGLQKADRPLCLHKRQVLGGADRPDGQTRAHDRDPSVAPSAAHRSAVLTSASSDRDAGDWAAVSTGSL
jgi:hypothetical protein